MNGTRLVSCNSSISTANNGTQLISKIYFNIPLSSSTKAILLLLLVVIATIAFGGNILILLFVKTKERACSFPNACSFHKNFNFYIKSLAISDVLCSVIAIPFFVIRLYLNVIRKSVWLCKIGGYFLFLFPFITINNLLVISLGKYFATRQVPRTLSHSTLKKVVTFAWLAGFLVATIPAATLGMRYDLNDTHYTETCRFNNQYLPFRTMFVSIAFLQYIIPSFILITVNILLIVTVWKRTRRTINVTMDNGVRAMARAARIRCIYVVVALTFAFVTPYFCYFAYVVYNMVAQPKMSYESDQDIRIVNVTIALSNSAINVIIYFVQMKDFRTFLKEEFFSKFFNEHPNNDTVMDAIEMQPQGNC